MNDSSTTPLPPPPECLAAQSAFFLDVDGTLLTIASDPASVIVDSEIVELVKVLHALSGGALALVSGRSLTDVDRILGMNWLPVAGQHGAERRNAQMKVYNYVSSKNALSGVRKLIINSLRTFPGLLIEDKSLSIAIHYRQAPELARPVQTMLRHLLAVFPDLEMQPGKMVYEVRPAGIDKGLAIRKFMGEMPFNGRRAVFLGDDATDELGFAAINAIDGLSVKIGREPTVARFNLPDVSAVRKWMKRIIHVARSTA